MSRRSSDLFEELQSIFGESFGHRAEPLTESMTEGAKHARGRDMRPMPSSKQGKDSISSRMRDQKGHKPGKTKRDRDLSGLNKIKRTAKKTATKDDDSALKSFFKDPEVRGDKRPSTKPKTREKEKSSSEGGGSRAQSAGKGAGHFPFKNSSNLGPGPRDQHHDETKCWNCTCPGNIYSSGCNCKSSGKGENCPPKGTLKKISYNKDYKKKYNDQYHAWRAGKKGEVTRRTSGR